MTDLEVSDLLELRIDTGDALPQRDRPFRHTPAEKKLIKEYATELLNAKKLHIPIRHGKRTFYLSRRRRDRPCAR
jgi:hypothetical protein